jgi:hypothetical protein
VTTAHSLHRFKEDTIIRNRKRPKLTSTNARITRPIFGDLARKDLAIPKVIDDYNHHMNGVDLANQLRAWMTVLRPGIYKAWQPLWYYLLDTCACNAYLIWKSNHSELNPRDSRLHRKFQERLIQLLIEVPDEREAPVLPVVLPSQATGHLMNRMLQKLECRQCLKGREQERKFGTQLVNGVTPKRSPRSQFGCTTCRAHLCKDGPCWKLYHASASC